MRIRLPLIILYHNIIKIKPKFSRNWGQLMFKHIIDNDIELRLVDMHHAGDMFKSIDYYSCVTSLWSKC